MPDEKKRIDYYPFGMPMPNRQTRSAYGYRYEYQGQEKDPETGKEAFELRLWDGRIGRWLTTDPYGQFFSPYLGMGNNPVRMIDPDGGTCYDAETHQVVDCGEGGINILHNIDTDSTLGYDEAWDVMVLDEVFIPNKNDWRSAAWQLRQANELANMIAGIHEAQREPAQAMAFIYSLMLGNIFSVASTPVSLSRSYQLSRGGLGKQGERLAGLSGPKTRIPSATGTAKYRIPDGLTKTTLSESKNVKNLSLTSQIRDFNIYAKQNNLHFRLFTRSTTEISKPLQELIDNGQITHDFLKGL